VEGLWIGLKPCIVGVLQGCVLSTLLFNIFLEIKMAKALHNVDVSVVLSGNVINKLRFADDIAAVTNNEYHLQTVVDVIDRESSRLGMRINTDKTRVTIDIKQIRGRTK